MRAVEFDDLEPPMLLGAGAADRDRQLLAVGRPARRGRPLTGREDATAALPVDDRRPRCPTGPSAGRRCRAGAGRPARSARRTDCRPP